MSNVTLTTRNGGSFGTIGGSAHTTWVSSSPSHTTWVSSSPSHSHSIAAAPHNHGVFLNMNVQTTTRNADFCVTGDKVFIVLPNGETLDVVALLKLVGELAERVKVLQPLLEKHEDYPALASAYDQYKVVERLVRSAEEDKE